MMRLVKLPANNSWVFLFGDKITTATIVPMGENRFYATRMGATTEARRHGIYVDKRGVCAVLDCCDEASSHSEDLVTLWCGYSEPAMVCGRHAQALGVATHAHIAARLV